MSRAINGSIWVVLISAICFILVCAYWLLYPYKVYTMHEIKVLNDPVTAGDDAMVQVKFEKFLNIPCTITRELINGSALSLSAPRTSSIPVGPGQWILPIHIPQVVMPGKGYQIHTTYTYRVNPIRTIRVEWTTPEFEIIPAENITASQKRLLKNALKELIAEENAK